MRAALMGLTFGLSLLLPVSAARAQGPARSPVGVTEPIDIIATGASADNGSPVVTAPDTASVVVGHTLRFDVTATDPDTDHVDLAGSPLPPGSSFVDHGNSTGTFSWTPMSGQAGVYMAFFSGLDPFGGFGSAISIITVVGGAVVENHPPALSAPATEQVDEGVLLSFVVTATDPDGDHVALSATGLPSGATFSDLGDNRGEFSWTPDTTRSGTYEVAFDGDDGNGGSGTATTRITVRDVKVVGPGPGEVAGSACLIRPFKPGGASTCFRLQAFDGSFDLRDVVLSSIRLRFEGETLGALDSARIEVACHHDDGGVDAGDLDHGDADDGRACNVTCSRGHHDDKSGNGCDTLGIHVCFATDSLMRLFASVTEHPGHAYGHLPCALVDAQMLATLTSGATVAATFGGSNDHGDGNDDHRDSTIAGASQGMLNPRVTPNPLAPSTRLTFTMARAGQVRVAIYDMQGRLVKRLMDEFRASGSHAVAWDGTNDASVRVTSGVYFVRVVAPEGFVTSRVTVVR